LSLTDLNKVTEMPEVQEVEERIGVFVRSYGSASTMAFPLEMPSLLPAKVTLFSVLYLVSIMHSLFLRNAPAIRPDPTKRVVSTRLV